MKMYRTSTTSIEIEEIEIDRCTDHNVWFTANLYGKTRQHMEARSSGYQHWHDTREDAVKFLMDKLEYKKGSLERSLVQVNKDIATLC